VAPYEERDTWTLNVMMIDDTLYFEEHLTDAKLAEKSVDESTSFPSLHLIREDMSPKLRKLVYNG
jgi:hypothetical protein